MRHELSSTALATIANCHPVSIRRLIKRPKRIAQPPTTKRALIEARKAYRKSIAHLPAREIQRLAHVSLTTAQRIRKAYA